jgi:hypothetical protein
MKNTTANQTEFVMFAENNVLRSELANVYAWRTYPSLHTQEPTIVV